MNAIEVRDEANRRWDEICREIKDCIERGSCTDGSTLTIEWLASKASAAHGYRTLAKMLTPFAYWDGL